MSINYKLKTLPQVVSLIEKGIIKFVDESEVKSFKKDKIYYKVGDTEFSNYILGENIDALDYFVGLYNENPGAVKMVACVIDTMPGVWLMEKYHSIKKYFIDTLSVNEDKISQLAKRPIILISINNDMIKSNGTFSQQYHEAGDNFTSIMELKKLIIFRNSQYCEGLSEVKAPTFNLFIDMVKELSSKGKVSDLQYVIAELRKMFDFLEILYNDNV